MSDLNYVRERWLDTRYSMHYVDGEQKAVLFVDDANFLMREGLEFLDRIVAQERELAALRRVRDAVKGIEWKQRDVMSDDPWYETDCVDEVNAIKAALESEAGK